MAMMETSNVSAAYGPKQRDLVVRYLDQMKAAVLERLDAGGTIILHKVSTLAPIRWDDLLPITDFMYTGWSYGVSIGDYPRKK